MSQETERTSRRAETDYGFLRSDWNSEWKPYRDLLGTIVGIVVANGPGLFWLDIFLDALRNAESSAFWFGPTPTGETSVAAEYSIAVVLAVLWFGMVLAMFKKPLKESIGEIRS